MYHHPRAQVHAAETAEKMSIRYQPNAHVGMQLTLSHKPTMPEE